MPEPTGPLAHLAQCLREVAPPSVAHLVQWVRQHEGYRDFLLLIQEYLPEHQEEILAELGVGSRMAAFAQRFEERYFEFHSAFRDGWIEEYGDLTERIPVMTMGVGWEEYHALTDWRLGYQLLAALTTDPYEGDGGRQTILESCAQHIPIELLRRLGPGYSPQDLHAQLDGTPLEGVALAADYFHANTGSAFLDIDPEMAGEEWLSWDPDTVRELAEDWARGRVINDRIHAMAEWLEVEPAQRLRELLQRIEGKGVRK